MPVGETRDITDSWVKRNEMKKSGQMEMFLRIWDNRSWISEVSGKGLHHFGHFQWHWQFAHIIGKGAYPNYKLNPDNIVLVTPDEHHLWDNCKSKIKDLPEWQQLFEKEELLKEQYHRDRK